MTSQNQKTSEHFFNPTEIIFCPTSECNLRCRHCFVYKENTELDIELAEEFLRNAVKESNGAITHVGFSGGEPFLKPDFLCRIIKLSVELDLYFDRITTNGRWWKTEDELNCTIKSIYDSGFDGKIGLSWDSFHGMNIEKAAAFINHVHQISNDKTSVEILSVASSENLSTDNVDFLQSAKKLGELINGKTSGKLNKKNGNGILQIENDFGLSLPIYRFSQSFMPDMYAARDGNKIWHEKKWFTDDYCEHTGQTLFIHANGNIAPCCGFANERPELKIGTIKDSFETIMSNASKNPMVNLCFVKGLSSCIKDLKKEGIKTGKTSDMCQFCAFMCQYSDNFTEQNS